MIMSVETKNYELPATREGILMEQEIPDPLYSGKWVAGLITALDINRDSGMQFATHEVILASGDDMGYVSIAANQILQNLGIDIGSTRTLHFHPSEEGYFIDIE
jgi:hypothetical protein